MKKVKLTVEDKEKLVNEFRKQLDDSEATGVEKVIFEKTITDASKDKVTIYFTPAAYLRSQALVKHYAGEIGWHGLVEKLSDREYKVYDIIVYPQMVSGARTLDPTKENLWYEKYEDVLDEMRFQAHSHVEMSTFASDTDKSNQKNVVNNMGGTGYMIFQIWNKKGDINTFLYDIDNNLLYERGDVIIEILDDEYGTMSAFVRESDKLVEEPKIVAKQKQNIIPATNAFRPEMNEVYTTGYQWKPPAEWNADKEKITNPFYWRDGNGMEGWT